MCRTAVFNPKKREAQNTLYEKEKAHAFNHTPHMLPATNKSLIQKKMSKKKNLKKLEILTQVAIHQIIKEAVKPLDPPLCMDLAWNILSARILLVNPLKKHLETKYFEKYGLFFNTNSFDGDDLSFHVYQTNKNPPTEPPLHIITLIFRSFQNPQFPISYTPVSDFYAELVPPNWRFKMSRPTLMHTQDILGIRFFFLNGIPCGQESSKLFDYAKKTASFHGKYSLFITSLEDLVEFWVKIAISESNLLSR